MNGADCVVALNELSLAVEEGTFLGVMGPSGSGKSTLLSVLGGLARPTSGTVSVDGIDVYGLSRVKLADFRRVGLPDRMLHLPQQLSGGEQERVAIARALINRPPLLLADEPTGSLDTTTSQQVMSLLKELHEDGQTIIMVTHNRENLQWFERTVTMRDGRVERDVGASRTLVSQAV